MYDLKPSKDYCEQIGMRFDEDDFEEFGRLAKKHDLTQGQVDFAMEQHAWRVKCLFDPNTYTVWARILLAFHFLKG